MQRLIFTPKRELLLHRRTTDSLDALPQAEICVGSEAAQRFRFEIEGLEFEALEVSEKFGVAGHYWVPLRPACHLLPPSQYLGACKGAQLLNWDSESRYCGHCGGLLRRSGPISKHCDGCGREHFPRISPCIIVLVMRGEELLLVHARTFAKPFYGLVAGFVEPGETLEECVRREVREETSLEIKNIKYVDSQAWPYPSQLMMGFTAEYASGQLCFADQELTSGGFFRTEELPTLPSPPSIARRLIDRAVEGIRAKK